MYIQKIAIKNFRLLQAIELLLEQRTTTIVGRNNSGKTSLAELFRRLLSDSSPRFRLEDFSLAVHEDFWKAFLLKVQGAAEDKIREAVPFIEVKLYVSYDKNSSDLGVLTEFIIDLDENCTDALIVIRYHLKDGEAAALFADLEIDRSLSEEEQKTELCRAIREGLPDYFSSTVFAVDPNDPSNEKVMDWSNLRDLIHSGFINAQRGLDDITNRDRDVLGKILETLFQAASSDSADSKDREIAGKLEEAVKNIQKNIDDGFNKQLEDLLPTFSLFGYPGLSDPRLKTETTLDVLRLLSDHTKVHYAGVNGINLPEAYNGLGVRNLIFILLKLLEFFKSFMAREPAPGTHLVFIEEPEVHLHPQMQAVFISKLNDIVDVFSEKLGNGISWPVQFVITTHSSHLANKVPFDALRYFLATSNESSGSVRSAQIKDLRNGLGGQLREDRDFLHKYMTLTRCDLLFADKAVLIEGTTERLLLPQMIERLDVGAPLNARLSSQYLSIVEVGGAYAHLFFNLLNFLELPTLIITDLDTVNSVGKQCKVSEGTHTSNNCIKKWFSDQNITPTALIRKSDEEKTDGIRRLAYQVPEMIGGPCGRSFEAAFMLANPELFGLSESPLQEKELRAWEMSERVTKKSDFALEYAINKTQWVVPRYISDGLRWLAQSGQTLTYSQTGDSESLAPMPGESEQANV